MAREEKGAALMEVARPTTAIFIAHGMGQQVPFDTLTAVACGLLHSDAKGQARILDVGDQRVQRLEMEVDDKPVHVYEGYWAPLTEGAVGIKDVLRFLFSGAVNGISLATGSGVFQRYKTKHKIPASTVASILGVLLVLSSLIVMNAIIAAVLATRFTFGTPGWVTNAMLEDLATMFEIVLVAAVISGAGLMLSKKPKGGGRRALIIPVNVLLVVTALLIVVAGLVGVPLIVARDRVGTVSRLWLEPSWLKLIFRCSVILAALGVLLYLAYKIVHFLWRRRLPKECRAENAKDDTPPRSGGGRGLAVLVILVCVAITAALLGTLWHYWSSFDVGARSAGVFALLALLSAFIRQVLVQYVGDVAAYVQPHKVDRFYHLRDEIKTLVYNRMCAVYECKEPRYERILIVGHSLGSVVVYDALNRLINDDDLVTDATKKRDVINRTPLLLTFGSPLDKTAFIFHVNSTPKDVDAKEALAATVQPILDGHRPAAWINVYSPQDIISGKLDYYGVVDNKPDPKAATPLAAHVQYWDNDLIYDIMKSHL